MIEFRVDDMTSNLCAGTIADAIKTIDQDALVEVNLSEKIVRVDSILAADDIEAAIRNLGYTAVTEPQQGW
ncbi:MAG: heavy-metal-associated domain-containing protein [Formivibrio sp.]|nr:heavy-metal-associated domain-containing protein [Formivibrio sp.]